ncbi:UPF0149 family protein [Mangrovimicrobium sediminis]|nr:UPF0149 family protein [Haliea sp. SAOS-164]
MHEFFDTETTVFDFDEMAGHLLEQGVDASPSDLHGCLCGLLAAGAPAQPEAGFALLAQALDVDLHGELAGLVMQLYEVSAAALEDDEFDFHPLLPDDDSEIEVRTLALVGWVRSFITGFTRVNRETVRQDSAEILRDFAAIAQANVDEGASEEESEDSYLELVEYLRFAALNVFMDSRADSVAPEAPSLH